MKRLIIIILLLASSLTFAQRFEVNPEKIQKHKFGFGITTDILAGVRDMNNFKIYTLQDVSMNFNPYEELTLFSSNFYSYYLEYQYLLTKEWYFSTRLKFNDRNLKYYYTFNTGNMQSMTINLFDIEIPVMANFKLPLSENTNWIAFLGGGASFNISKDDEPAIDYKILAMDGTTLRTYHLDFEIKNNINYFLSLGTGFDFAWNKHKFQTFISYTIYFMDTYKFNHLTNGNGVVNRDWSKQAFSQNNLEVGLAFFW